MQPTYLPWIGYFSLIDQVDVLVFLDDVEFSHQSWQQRNRIKTDDGPMWLTVPVITSGRSGQIIREVEINTEERWRPKHRRSIHFNYANAEYYSEHDKWLEEVYNREWEKLCELNIFLIEDLMRKLGMEVNIIFSSNLDAAGEKSHRLVNICKEIGAPEYLSPLGSKDYIENENPFPEAGIDLRYHSFEHPEYDQLYNGFVSHMSIIDLILNAGPNSISVIREGQLKPHTSQDIENG